MTDLEKVIKGLECCYGKVCEDCPYVNDCWAKDDDNDLFPLASDALELLKAQEKTKVIFSQDDGSIETVCGKCGYGLDKTYSVCPKCGKELDWNG